MAAKRYKTDDSKLCCLINQRHHELQPYRDERLRIVRLMASQRYAQNVYTKKTYVNLLSLWKKIVSRNLFAQNPRVMLSTFEMSAKASVSAAETWMNQELVRQNFTQTMKALVGDALVGPMGLAVVGLATPSEAAMSGWGLTAGQAFISPLDFEDFSCDLQPRRFDQCDFLAWRVRVPLESVVDNPNFNKKARQKLEPMLAAAYNAAGDERIGTLGRQDSGFYYEDLEDKVELWYAYLPRHRVIKVFADQDTRGPTSAWEGNMPVALDEYPWIGHERGPIVTLGYDDVSGNLIPKGAATDLADLHEGVNEGYRKLMRQAARYKKHTAGSRDNPEDVEALRTADDGSPVLMGNPQMIHEVVQGGPDPGLFAWVKENIDRFMEQAGNLATLGGLSAQANTLGQEELLQQQSNGQVASMQDITVSAVADICDRMLWYFWHDPRHVMQAEVNDPNLPDVRYVRKVYPANHPDENALKRTGKKPDIKIDPYSMRHTTPQQRAKDVLSVVTQVYVPLAQLAQAQGVSVDLHELFALLGKQMDMPDLQTILKIQAPMQGQVGDSPEDGGGTGPTKPPSTTREYVRKSAGGANSAASQDMQQDNALSAAMAGGGGKPNGQPRRMIP